MNARSARHLTIRLAIGSAIVAAVLSASSAHALNVRPIAVSAPGWVRVPLDAAAIASLGGGAPRLLDPRGELVAARRAVAGSSGAEIDARLLSIHPAAGGGWQLAFDLGERPPRHDRLRLAFGSDLVANGCAVEASEDGARFVPLGRGDLFQLGASAGLTRSELAYPPTAARFLRLAWPPEANRPELDRAVAVAVPSEGPLHLPVAAERGPAIRGARWWVPAPGAAATPRRLLVTSTPGGRLVYRLSVAERGWRTLREGAVVAEEDATAAIELPAGLHLAGRLRLDLFGPTATSVAGGFVWELEPVVLEFRARRAGRFVLVAAPYEGSGDHESPAPDTTWTAARLEALETVADPPLPESTRAASELARAGFSRHLRLESEGAVAGELVELELPSELQSVVALRVVAAGRQWPYLRSTLPEPLLLSQAHPSPTPGERPGSSLVRLETGESAAPASAFEIRTAAGPFSRRVRLRERATESPGSPWREVSSSPWHCPGPEPPCAYSVPISSRHMGERELVIDDGDNPPLAALEVELWGLVDRLRFAWPASGPVELWVGEDRMSRPRYDLELSAEELWARAARPARAVAEPPAATLERWGRPLMLAALALSALGLLALLARLLKKAPAT